jgi:hypothetical protein
LLWEPSLGEYIDVKPFLNLKKLRSLAATLASAFSLRSLADKIDDTIKNCGIAKATGAGAGIVGGILTVTGGILVTVLFFAEPPTLYLIL